MYRTMYDQFNEELEAQKAQMGIAPKRAKGIIPKGEPLEAEKNDPLALIKQWMDIIKTSGETARKKAEAQLEKAPAPKVEPKKVEVKQEKETKETEPIQQKKSMASLFDDMGGDFSLPIYTGGDNEWTSLVRQAAEQEGIPEDLFLRLVNQESGFNPSARSSAGAIGLTQLMPGTARYLGVNPYDPQQNIMGGARYLREQFDKFGSWKLALAAYNAGPGAVEQHGGVPPYEETQNYVRSILF